MIKSDDDKPPTRACSSGEPAFEKAGKSDSSVDEAAEGMPEEESAPEDEEWEMVASVDTWIRVNSQSKGSRQIKLDDMVVCERAYTDTLDPTSIRVLAQSGLSIGSLPLQLAQHLAPLLDFDLIDLEAVVGQVLYGGFLVETVPLRLGIYAPKEFVTDPRLEFAFPERLREQVQAETVAKLARLHEGFSLYGAADASPDAPILEELTLDSLLVEAVSDMNYNAVDGLARYFPEGANDPSKLMEHPCPPGKKDKTMRTDLMPFQRQGLAWMVKMEHPQLPKTIDDAPVQLWLMKKDSKGGTFWFNLATETSQRDKPILKRGGLLADETGLGKTVETIALIVADDTGEGILETPEEPDDRFDDMTLIICPTSVASNWTDQFHTHVGSKRLGWHLYHADDKKMTKKQLRGFDVIIASYATLVLEHSATARSDSDQSRSMAGARRPQENRSSVLHDLKWRRVVLDEGHVIRDRNSMLSLACSALVAERRWILTGTPIVNSASDLGSMMTFLRLCRPLDDKAKWALIVESKSRSDPEGQAKLLRAVISSTTLRRTKYMANPGGHSLVKLPPIDFVIERVPLTPETRAIYDEVSNELKRRVQASIENGTAKNNYAVFLVFLLRMRQLACHPSLCPQSFISDVRSKQLDVKLVNFDSGASNDFRLQGILQEAVETSVNCSICEGRLEDPVVSRCKHVSCKSCLVQHLDNYALSLSQCRICFAYVEVKELVELSFSASEEDEVLVQQAIAGMDGAIKAAKTEVLIGHLQATEPTVKSLVFSQWNSHLNVIEASLAYAGIVTCRLDANMTQMERAAEIAIFAKPIKTVEGSKTREANAINGMQRKPLVGPPSVMLVPLDAQVLNSNLTSASQVFLMDPWWQSSIETQAIECAYRVGQTEDVKIFHLVASDTVEDRLFSAQVRNQEYLKNASAEMGHINDDEKDLNTIDLIVEILGGSKSRGG